MKSIPTRPIAPAEAAIVRDALLKAPLDEISASMVAEVELLKVVGECECGCRSLYFRQIEKSDYRVADGVGYMADGEKVGIMVWSAENGHVAALEIVDHGGKGQLPTTLCSWEEAGQREAQK